MIPLQHSALLTTPFLSLFGFSFSPYFSGQSLVFLQGPLYLRPLSVVYPHWLSLFTPHMQRWKSIRTQSPKPHAYVNSTCISIPSLTLELTHPYTTTTSDISHLICLKTISPSVPSSLA